MSAINNRHSPPLCVFVNLIALVFLLAEGAQQGLAQSTNYTKNTADSNLRGNLEVDLSTLGMSFNLPMGAYGGRGATLPISLTYSSKVWRLKHYLGQPGPTYYLNQIEPKYAEKSVAGWTSSTGVPYVEWTGTEQAYNLYPGDALCISCNPPSGDTESRSAEMVLQWQLNYRDQQQWQYYPCRSPAPIE